MPRDSAGNYTLPPGNPVVAGTIIDTSWANPTMADIAVQLNGVMTRDGLLAPTAQIAFVDGTQANPGIKFQTSPATGFFVPAVNQIGVSIAGTQKLLWTSSSFTNNLATIIDSGAGTTIAGTLAVNGGTAGTVGAGSRLAFGATAQGITPSRGAYLEASILNASNAYQLSVLVSGSAAVPTEVARFLSGAFRVIDGAVTAPSYGFINDADLGFMRAGANVIDVCGNGARAHRFDCNATPIFYVGDVASGTDPFLRLTFNRISNHTITGASNLQLESIPVDGTGAASMQFFRNTNTTGQVAVTIHKGNNSTTTEHTFYGSATVNPGLGATICQQQTRCIIGGIVDVDNATKLQLWVNSGRCMRIIDGSVSGVTPNTGIDALMIDANGPTGITIATPNDAISQIRFADPENNAIGGMTYNHVNDQLSLIANAATAIAAFGTSVHFPTITTTASAANAFLNSGSSPANSLLRSTSSRRYKQNIRDLPPSYLDVVGTLRPVIYNSKSEADDPTVDHIGLIAEEVEEITPVLVQYITNEEGHHVADGVAYDRLGVLLLLAVNDLVKRVEKLELH